MKDETKQKLKKAAKIGGLVAGFLATFILGMGFGSCSEKKMQDQGSQKQYHPKGLSPKFSLNVGDNLLEHATRYDGYSVLHVGDWNGAEVNGSYVTYLIPMEYMPEGKSYVITFDGSAGFLPAWADNGVGCIANAIVQRVENHTTFSGFDDSLVNWLSVNSLASPSFFNIPAGTYGGSGSARIATFCLTALNSITGLYVCDTDYWVNNADSVASVTLPVQFNPWEIMGSRASEFGAIGPALPVGTTSDVRVIQFRDLYFRSNGQWFDTILMSWVYRPGTYLGAYNESGAIYSKGTISSNAANPTYYLSQMNYYNSLTGLDFPVFSANFTPYSGTSDTDVLIAGGRWSNYNYRVIEILDDSRAYLNDLPSTAPQGMTPRQWLLALAQSSSETPAGGGNGDVFQMLSQGFSAVGGLLGIQILPWITLGTLVFVPLVCLVILAVIRLLAK